MEIEEIVEKLRSGDFNTGLALLNRWRTRKVIRRFELEEARAALALAIIESERRQQEAVKIRAESAYIRREVEIQAELSLARHGLEALEIEVRQNLTRQAMGKGRTIETDQQLILEEALGDLRIDEKRKLSEIEVETEFKKAMNTLAAIARFKHLQFDAFDEIRGRINTLLSEEYKIELSNLPVQIKAAQLDVVRQAVEAYQEVFRAQRNRLLETSDGPAVQGATNLFTYTGTSIGNGSEKVTDEIPVKDIGNRPERSLLAD